MDIVSSYTVAGYKSSMLVSLVLMYMCPNCNFTWYKVCTSHAHVGSCNISIIAIIQY